MKKVFYKRDHVELLVDTEPFASGGEGNLYRIRKPAKYSRFVVKLYHQDKRTNARQEKVEYMITNPPIDYVQQDHYSVIWPQGMVFERSGFAGFLMPFAKGEKLEILSMPRIRRNLLARWGRFDFSKAEAMQLRLKICYNIAAAVYQVHETDHYVLVDLKTDNIIIQPNGLISIVDMDSVEVIDGNTVLFPATVTTPEYTPPEYYTKNVQPGKQPIYESWDLFSLSIIFYKLLFGIHPYAASSKPPYEKLTSLHQKIEAGLFVHSNLKAPHFKVIPPPHRKFNAVNPAIQGLFIRTFEEGHDNPEVRPDADEWCWAIAPAPRLSIDRKLPSRSANIGKITYSKPLHLVTNTSQILPSVPPPKLPTIPASTFSSPMLIPRGITGGAVSLFFIWMFVFGISFTFSGIIQLATFFATSMGMLYAYYRELPEHKQQNLVSTQLKKLRSERKETNTELLHMKAKIARLPKKQKQLTGNFEKNQKENLIFEKKEIEKYIQDLRQFLANQDKKARKLLKEEISGTQALQKHFFGATYDHFKRLSRIPVDEQLEWLQKEKASLKKRIEFKYRQRMTNIQQEAEKHKIVEKVALKKTFNDKIQGVELDIKELKERKNAEVTRIKKMSLIKVGEGLRKYGIRANAKTIFSDNGPLIGVICDYLERSGIRSAADFIDVNAEGKVKKMNAQKFEKVPFMTPERGVELKEWLISLSAELGSGNELTREEEAKLSSRYDDSRLLKKIETIKLEYYQAANKLSQSDNIETEKTLILNTYKEELAKANEKIDMAIDLLSINKDAYEAEVKGVEEKYNALHETIAAESKTFSANIKSKIEAINSTTFGNNNELLDKVMRQIETASSKSEMNAMLNYNNKQQTLNNMDKLFYELKSKNERFKEISFDKYLKHVVKFK